MDKRMHKRRRNGSWGQITTEAAEDGRTEQRGNERVTGEQPRLHKTDRNSDRREGSAHRSAYVGDKVKVTPGFILS